MEYPKTIQKDITINGRNYLNKLRNACKLCNHTGIKILSEDTCEQCICTKKFYQDRKYIDANIPDNYFEMPISELNKNYTSGCFGGYSKIFNNINSLLDKGYNLMFLKGNDISWGITTAGTLLIKKLVDLYKKCLIIDSLKLFDCFFSFGNESDLNSEKTKQFNFYIDFPVLMIDGIGTEGYRLEQKQGFIFQKFCNFLKRRKALSKPTILCCDLKLEELREIYDKSLVRFIDNDVLKFKIYTNFPKTSINFKIHKELAELTGVFDDVQKPISEIKAESKTIIPRR